jgi:hypothetical protein
MIGKISRKNVYLLNKDVKIIDFSSEDFHPFYEATVLCRHPQISFNKEKKFFKATIKFL